MLKSRSLKNYRRFKSFSNLDSPSDFEEDCRKYGADFSTGIVFTKAFGFNNLEISVLGFGIGVSRQYSY